MLFALCAIASATGPLTVKSCAANAPVKINSLSIVPDNPITVGQPLSLSFDLEVTEPITEGKLSLKLEKEILFWITVPCKNGVGSCTYDNFCTMLNNVTSECNSAAQALNMDLPCKCPIQPSRYTATIPIPAFQIPSSIEWAAKGNYRVHFDITDKSRKLACYDITFSLDVKK